MDNLQPQVGVVTMVFKNGRILFAKRYKPIGRGHWALPGGHLEMYETFEECAERETMEEAGIKIKNIQFLVARNNRYPEHNKHYITIIMMAEWAEGDPVVPDSEKEKHGNWEWFDLSNLPDPLFETKPVFEDKILASRIHTYSFFIRPTDDSKR